MDAAVRKIRLPKIFVMRHDAGGSSWKLMYFVLTEVPYQLKKQNNW